MQLAFELSGEHETLPRAEVFACLDALSIAYEASTLFDRILVIDAQQLSPENELLDALSRRLGLTHHIYEVNGMSALAEQEIVELVNGVDFEAVMDKGDTFAVRARFVRKSSLLYGKRRELLTRVGACIKGKGYKVNLEQPSRTFVLLFTGEVCLFSSLLHSVRKAQFEEKRPHFRPFFSPGVIMPKIARALVNLSEVRAAELILDPFCGTGGILIEAGMVGARIGGADVQEKMVRGAKENLAFFGLHGELLVSDASKLPLKNKSVDAIATDLPYGRASFVSGYGSGSGSGSDTLSTESRSIFLERLYQDALAEMHRVLRPGRRAVIVSNSPSALSRAPTLGFHVLEEHAYRVHKSLTRHITVLEKE